MVNPIQIATGQLLLSEPFMLDRHFRRTGVLLCEHGEGGTLGFILNRRQRQSVGDLLPDLEDFAAKVYYGGPVNTDAIQYLHTRGDLLDTSCEVLPGVYWGGDFEQLKFYALNGIIHPDEVRFYRGYTGWSQGQLVDEIRRQDWIHTDGHADYVFADRPNFLWKEAMMNEGSFRSALAFLPGAEVMN